MKSRLLTYDYILWLSIILCQCAACFAVVRRREFYRHWKVFSYYLFYMTVSSIVMLVISLVGTPDQFIIGYSAIDFIEAILLNGRDVREIQSQAPTIVEKLRRAMQVEETMTPCYL